MTKYFFNAATHTHDACFRVNVFSVWNEIYINRIIHYQLDVYQAPRIFIWSVSYVVLGQLNLTPSRHTNTQRPVQLLSVQTWRVSFRHSFIPLSKLMWLFDIQFIGILSSCTFFYIDGAIIVSNTENKRTSNTQRPVQLLSVQTWRVSFRHSFIPLSKLMWFFDIQFIGILSSCTFFYIDGAIIVSNTENKRTSKNMYHHLHDYIVKCYIPYPLNCKSAWFDRDARLIFLNTGYHTAQTQTQTMFIQPK